MQDDIDYVGMVIAEDAAERAAKIGGLVERLVEAVADVGIENYVGSVVAVSDEGGTSQDVVVTVQRLNGKTPHELREEAEAENAELRQQLADVTAERDIAQRHLDRMIAAHDTSEARNTTLEDLLQVFIDNSDDGDVVELSRHALNKSTEVQP